MGGEDRCTAVILVLDIISSEKLEVMTLCQGATHSKLYGYTIKVLANHITLSQHYAAMSIFTRSNIVYKHDTNADPISSHFFPLWNQ